MNNRIEKLLQFYKEEPNDPFTIYALATEYLAFDPQKAKEYFDLLLLQHEDYVGTYYHAAQLYADLDLIEEAKGIYEKGLAVAQKVKNPHAERELKTAYQNFLLENY